MSAVEVDSKHNAQAQQLVRCNHCKKTMPWSQTGIHVRECAEIAKDKKLDKIAMERDGLRMYAVACARYIRPQSYEMQIHYLHAENDGHAKAQFCRSYTNRHTHRIIACGLVIGWQVDEKTEKVLVH